ncbi:hypothetical protein AMAG_13382 [Allomyces macrogynus ATCC 38327]|uniref:Deacetylase sirtuin-type domain-containing protein n=1 Tax=Allomyces macrogynus (strain ATCC 38327) TaxID=578462 RepID=A0A0L0T1W2_ALLM3|nr:hypothetical protein AMAG_13382 [Allomyces macrogynus ATCC 38327]|eukprot:KNE68741.1 hypothetical protein AMAG_13382 [Allomyces macrogynus ATCC 38327]
MLGYGTIFHAQPNTIHHSLAEIEAKGHLVGVVAQNVDLLHHNAGGRNVIELHGTLARVECQSCGRAILRDEFQQIQPDLGPALRPDGDLDVALEFGQFAYPPCHKCGNEEVTTPTATVKSNIPPKVMQQAAELVGKGSGGLVVGSTLTTYSAYRLVCDLHTAGKPVWCIKKGPMRADALLARKIEAPIQEIMADVVEMH